MVVPYLPYILLGGGVLLVVLVVIIIVKNQGKKEGYKWKTKDKDGKEVTGKKCKKCKDKSLRQQYPCKHPTIKGTCCTPEGQCETNKHIKEAVSSGTCATDRCPDPKRRKTYPCLHRELKKCCDYNLKNCVWMTSANFENSQKTAPTLSTTEVDGKKCEFARKKNNKCPSSHPFKVDGANVSGKECTTSRKCAKSVVASEPVAAPAAPPAAAPVAPPAAAPAPPAAAPAPAAANSPPCTQTCGDVDIYKHEDGSCWNHNRSDEFMDPITQEVKWVKCENCYC